MRTSYFIWSKRLVVWFLFPSLQKINCIYFYTCLSRCIQSTSFFENDFKKYDCKKYWKTADCYLMVNCVKLQTAIRNLFPIRSFLRGYFHSCVLFSLFVMRRLQNRLIKRFFIWFGLLMAKINRTYVLSKYLVRIIITMYFYYFSHVILVI